MAKVMIEIDLSKSVERNAGVYYDKVKKAKHKIEGAMLAVNRAKKGLAEYEKQKEEEIAKIEAMEKEELEKSNKKKEWFENFRWFISSDGFLVIGGRDATTNEIVIKKHTDKEDLCFHTDMAGSPFFVLKLKENFLGKKVKHNEGTLKQVADSTCSYSRAWKLKLAAQDVFYVKPEQVSKEPNPGEYLAKGAFVIRGKTLYMDNNVNCAIGVVSSLGLSGKVMGGPVEAVSKHCKEYVELKQGDKKTSDVAKLISKKLGVDVDDVIRQMPSGGVDIRV